ncbi:hypothetical protein ABBQ38_012910 [Trebouxia sp. C0009 RCD-2024]
MQLSRPLWIILAIACALIVLAANTINSSTTTTAAFARARSTYHQGSDLSGAPDVVKTVVPSSSLLAFVGVFTAIKSDRRQALRSTWFPSSETELLRVEDDLKIRLRFVVGHLQDPADQAAVEEEQRVHNDFLVVNVQETYDNLVLKVYTFFQDVQATYNPAYIIKTDDDLYTRPDRIAQAIPQWQARGSGYIGAMRVGTEAHDMKESPWYEPLGILHSHRYYMYASGCMYALSREAAQLVTGVPFSQRRLAGGGEDASVGLWVLGYNIPYLDDRRICMGLTDDGSCPDNFLVATAGCNGLCDPVETVPRLHQDPNCTKTDTGDLVLMESGYDFGPVGCVKVDDDGNVNKTSCFELE